MTQSQAGDTWRPITGPVLPGSWCVAPRSASLIQQRRSVAINIALPAEQQRTSLPQIDRGRQRPVIKSPSTVMRQKY